MAPYHYCSNCQKTTPISFSACGPSKTLAINRCYVFANKCVGGTHSDLSMFFAMLDLPPPVEVDPAWQKFPIHQGNSRWECW